VTQTDDAQSSTGEGMPADLGPVARFYLAIDDMLTTGEEDEKA
jgi:hypothetical protein